MIYGKATVDEEKSNDVFVLLASPKGHVTWARWPRKDAFATRNSMEARGIRVFEVTSEEMQKWLLESRS